MTAKQRNDANGKAVFFMRKRPCRNKNRAQTVCAFGLGIIIATFLPYKVLMLILGITLMLLGFAYMKCH